MRFVCIALAFFIQAVVAQEPVTPSSWSNLEIDGNHYCQRDETGDLIDPDGSDRRGAVTRVCNNWTELEAKLREIGIALVRITPAPAPEAFVMPPVVGSIAGGEAEELIDRAAGFKAPIDYQSRCLWGAHHEVLAQSPPSGDIVQPNQQILLTVKTDSIC